MKEKEQEIQKTNELILKLCPDLFYKDKETGIVYTVDKVGE